jgi:hypothetical protein
MALPVVLGATTKCSFGVSPGTLVPIPTGVPVLIENKPAATIMDNKPFANILPFGLCQSLTNPMTASLTAAALGVLTPGPCTPITVAPWAPGSPTMLIGSSPALTDSSMCNCAYGGVITISYAGTSKELIP